MRQLAFLLITKDSWVQVKWMKVPKAICGSMIPQLIHGRRKRSLRVIRIMAHDPVLLHSPLEVLHTLHSVLITRASIFWMNAGVMILLQISGLKHFHFPEHWHQDSLPLLLKEKATCAVQLMKYGNLTRLRAGNKKQTFLQL